MLDARIELRGEDLYCSDLSGEGGTSVKRLTSETLSLLQEWAGRYDAAVASRQPVAFAAIGRDIAALLNEGDGWLDRGLRGVGEIGLEIVVAGTPDARSRLAGAALGDPGAGRHLPCRRRGASVSGRAAAGCGGDAALAFAS